jgi:uncharacterized membrane protein YesL
MRDLFSCDSKFMQILHTISDHILLNLLFIICCIPVVTIGAAQAGLYSGIRVLRDEEDDSSCFRAFWKGFGIGFGKITFVWLGTALIAGLSGSCLLYQMTLEQTDYVLLFPCLIILVICMVYQTVLSLFHSRFGCTITQLIRNVVYMMIAHPLHCVAVTVLMWVPAAIFVYAPELFMKMTYVWLAAYYSVAFGMNLRIIEKPFAVLEEGFKEKNKCM